MSSHYDHERRRDRESAIEGSRSREGSRSPSPARRGSRHDSGGGGGGHRNLLGLPHRDERRHSSPGEYSLTKALMAAAGGAAAATLIDKNLVQGHGLHRKRSGRDDDSGASGHHGGHHHRDDAKDADDGNHGLRRVIDIAVGGYAGYGAYNYYQGHHHRKHSKDAADDAEKGAHGLLPHAPRRHHSHDDRGAKGHRRRGSDDDSDDDSDRDSSHRRVRSHSRSHPHEPVRGYLEDRPRQDSHPAYYNDYNDRRQSDYGGR